MGNPYYSDDEGVMCYNPAKNFQMAMGSHSWYNDHDHDVLVWDSSADPGTQWSGTIIGISDYENNPDARPVVVKLETGTSKDLFVGFNRAWGINQDVADARDEVTVMEAGSNGMGYSQSFLKAILPEGGSYRVRNWRNSGVDMTIRVREINLSADPGYADVVMSFGDPTLDPSPDPTRHPTRLPTRVPTLLPTSAPTRLPTRNPTPSPTRNPTKKPIYLPCGNSICGSDENSSTCPADCLGRELETSFEYNLGSGGNMFTVVAERSVVVTSFDINSSSRGEGHVKIYTRAGSYVDHIESSQGWELIYDNPNAIHARRGSRTELGDFERGVSIAGGTSQSFYVTSTKGLVYRAGVQENSVYTSDESLSILEGIGTDDTFTGRTFSPRVWGGRIR